MQAVLDNLKYNEGKLPRSWLFYRVVAIGIVISWVVVYVVLIVAIGFLGHGIVEDLPRSDYILAMLGGLLGPAIFLSCVRGWCGREDARKAAMQPGADGRQI